VTGKIHVVGCRSQRSDFGAQRFPSIGVRI
jgi:hypothetical protein